MHKAVPASVALVRPGRLRRAVNLWTLDMSLSPVPWGLSIPAVRPWLITVVIIVLVSCKTAASIASVCADAMALVAGLLASSTAAKYSNPSNTPRPQASL